jgi:catechol 2,3-dioxygenase-like lactoylglutathione lyase family enzyme
VEQLSAEADIVFVGRQDVERALAAGAELFIALTTVKAGFGTRRVAFFKAPSGYIFEIIEILENLVPAV